jgi:hypothetical protein
MAISQKVEYVCRMGCLRHQEEMVFGEMAFITPGSSIDSAAICTRTSQASSEYNNQQ